jgi:hypothetical protein
MIGLLDEIPQIQNTLETKLKSLFLELNQLVGSDSIDLENLSLFNLLNTENFNTTFFQTEKSLALPGIIALHTFSLIYYKNLLWNLYLNFMKIVMSAF